MTVLRRFRMLIVAMAAVACGAVCAFVPGLPGLRAPFAIVLIFVLPGYALWSALFPGSREDPVRTAVFTLGLSVVVTIIGGVELGAYGAYSTRSWAALVAGTTLVAALVAHARRVPASAEVSPPAPRRRRRVARGAAAAVAGLASFALIGVAIGLARTPLPVPDDRGYTELSFGRIEASATSLPVRIVSHEADTRDFRLVIRVPGRPDGDRPLTVAPGQTVSVDVQVGETAIGTALIALVEGDGTVYRRLRIGVPVQGPAPPAVSDTRR